MEFIQKTEKNNSIKYFDMTVIREDKNMLVQKKNGLVIS